MTNTLPPTVYVKWIQSTNNPEDDFLLASEHPSEGAGQYDLNQTQKGITMENTSDQKIMKGLKFLTHGCSTIRDGVEYSYINAIGKWMKHPNPAEPDGNDCGPGRWHVMAKLSAEYAPKNWVAWRSKGRGIVGQSDEKFGCTEIMIMPIPQKLWYRYIRRFGNSANLSSANLRSANLSSANLRSANLSSANLSSADLRWANLRSADLSSADLRWADLSSANLRSANLSSANLRSANLSSADLRSADLRWANLSSADLRSADLRSANLRSADLNSANLSSADLNSADLRWANLRSADLSSADLSSADLRWANLSWANLSWADLRSATANQYTFFPDGFDLEKSKIKMEKS